MTERDDFGQHDERNEFVGGRDLTNCSKEQVKNDLRKQ